MRFSHEHSLRKGSEADSEEAENESKKGDDEKKHPPDPEDEEILLIEQVVAEDAENLRPGLLSRLPSIVVSTSDLARRKSFSIKSSKETEFLTSVGNTSHMGSWSFLPCCWND